MALLLQLVTLQATPGNDCGSHSAMADGTLAAARDTAGDPGKDCGSHRAVVDGNLAAAGDTAGDLGNGSATDGGTLTVAYSAVLMIATQRRPANSAVLEKWLRRPLLLASPSLSWLLL